MNKLSILASTTHAWSNDAGLKELSKSRQGRLAPGQVLIITTDGKDRRILRETSSQSNCNNKCATHATFQASEHALGMHTFSKADAMVATTLDATVSCSD